LGLERTYQDSRVQEVRDGRSVGDGLGWLGIFRRGAGAAAEGKSALSAGRTAAVRAGRVLCGAEGWVEVEEYCAAKLAFLRRFLPFEHGIANTASRTRIASHDTVSDVFNAPDREGFSGGLHRLGRSPAGEPSRDRGD
jgi:hypothetical protein